MCQSLGDGIVCQSLGDAVMYQSLGNGIVCQELGDDVMCQELGDAVFLPNPGFTKYHMINQRSIPLVCSAQLKTKLGRERIRISVV